MDVHRHQFGVEPICEVLQVAPSTYYAAKSRVPSLRSRTDGATTEKIHTVHADNYGVYGVRKVHAELNRQGHRVARCTVHRLMKRAGLRGITRSKGPRTTMTGAAPGPRPDLAERAFTADAPNRLWVADITYIRTFNGWVYAALVIDVFSRRVVGWRVSKPLRTDLALDALEMAVWNRQHVGRRIDGLVHPSDRGVQGGFNWLSQHLDQGVWKWDDLEAGVLLSPVDRRCAHQGDRPPTRARFSVASGPESLKASRPRTQQQRAGAMVADRTDLPEQERQDIAPAVGIGAVKYADLSSDREKDYVFGWDRMLAMDGNTAVYLQYALARIRSIPRRASDTPPLGSPVALTERAERELALRLARFPDAVQTTITHLQPHRMATYLFELATAFGSFYENCPVLKSEGRVRESRLALAAHTAMVLERGLDLLGITAPERL
ncbi:IS3 family transposase [Nocardiopsis sp. LOL_012]|uniref:IS3 family transposase n=1 Tax=Nocardiopsis sp. LOL_012 TaxID=3345409 RepID=UPI003A8B341F